MALLLFYRLSREKDAMENLACYIMRAFLPSPASIDRRGFSQRRMTYIPEKAKVDYQPKISGSRQ